jgi:hypothetical protein
MARPRDDFDWHLVESLIILEASEQYIAERLLIKDADEVNAKSIQAKIKLIQRRIKERYDCSFVQFRQQKFEGQKIKLRTYQWRSAEKGNVTMQIWLGKQYLGQSDKLQVDEQYELVTEFTKDETSSNSK